MVEERPKPLVKHHVVFWTRALLYFAVCVCGCCFAAALGLAFDKFKPAGKQECPLTARRTSTGSKHICIWTIFYGVALAVLSWGLAGVMIRNIVTARVKLTRFVFVELGTQCVVFALTLITAAVVQSNFNDLCNSVTKDTSASCSSVLDDGTSSTDQLYTRLLITSRSLWAAFVLTFFQLIILSIRTHMVVKRLASADINSPEQAQVESFATPYKPLSDDEDS
eukprot:m.265757 g.265757  ORF g.265757 m.265757 type:complete len:223 (+) comp29521_c0_seq1:64-732(+)